jgi:hypothetical protein
VLVGLLDELADAGVELVALAGPSLGLVVEPVAEVAVAVGLLVQLLLLVEDFLDELLLRHTLRGIQATDLKRAFDGPG